MTVYGLLYDISKDVNFWNKYTYKYGLKHIDRKHSDKSTSVVFLLVILMLVSASPYFKMITKPFCTIKIIFPNAI